MSIEIVNSCFIYFDIWIEFLKSNFKNVRGEEKCKKKYIYVNKMIIFYFIIL